MNTANDLRKRSKDELRSDLIELRRDQLELRINRSNEQMSNTARFRELRKDIARVKTVLNEMDRTDK